MERKDIQNPHFASSVGVHVDESYMLWIEEIKNRYKKAQIKAAVKVNVEQLLFNWQLGRDLVIRKIEERWGVGVVEQVSLDMKAAFPKSKGFSTTNLWNMKKWYLFYSQKAYAAKLQQLVGEIQSADKQMVVKLQQLVGEFGGTMNNSTEGEDFPWAFSFVPWGHHVQIITKCKNIDEALFYVRKTIEEGWSRQTLDNCLHAKLYKSQGGAICNFADYLSLEQSRLAQEITKDSYDLGFIALPEEYEESELEDELEKNITRFLLELGNGFAFLGRQKELIVAGKTRRIDMLFYHTRLHCYIVCELKAKTFEPEFAGKLNFYVNAVDELLKTEQDNPTIGLLICKDKNQTEVKWAFKGIQTPMGVASYDNVRMQEIRNTLPTEEDMSKRLDLMSKKKQQQ
ncbi:MAG: PDDEXK nuclease domain-containing protein [Prevotella sp.]|nr:PDDEXK nuclease domain-containing protein [Prevotella sp.]